MPPSIRLTDSLNVIWTFVGGLVSCAPFAGVMLSSSACAAAGDANSTAKTATSVRSRPARRAVVISDVIGLLSQNEAAQTLTSSGLGSDAAGAAGRTGRRRHATTRATKESTSAAPESASGSIGSDALPL